VLPILTTTEEDPPVVSTDEVEFCGMLLTVEALPTKSTLPDPTMVLLTDCEEDDGPGVGNPSAANPVGRVLPINPPNMTVLTLIMISSFVIFRAGGFQPGWCYEWVTGPFILIK
jgi:hypothetical protein